MIDRADSITFTDHNTLSAIEVYLKTNSALIRVMDRKYFLDTAAMGKIIKRVKSKSSKLDAMRKVNEELFAYGIYLWINDNS